MESKVLLYDTDGKKIGETFVRRARQLVRQQRAMWMDGGQSAVQFVADADNWAAPGARDEGPIPVFDDEEWMVDLAKRRIRKRRMFIAHSIVFSIVFTLVSVAVPLIHTGIIETDFGGNTEVLVQQIGFLATWLAAFIAHACVFAISMHKVHRPNGKDDRQGRVLDREVAEIKKILDGRR
ncbi:MAG: hypothetical protein LBE55_06465 [Clostridiales bacterium]|jgi:hypothetical protein|nr:hypothetical protein [Clostridiales bacterium]